MSVFIIAEAGVNHNGSLSDAIRLVDIAIEAKVDAVKFQTFIAENISTVFAKKAKYQDRDLTSKSQIEMLKKLELSFEDQKILFDYCKEKKIKFLSSPFDIQSVDFLVNLGLNIIKIPSGEITNLPYLSYIGKLNKKLILSTGMSNILEITEALRVLTTSGTQLNDITLLHTTSMYPAPLKDLNMNVITTLKNTFKTDVGYSDHSEGIDIPLIAVSLGSKVIEKHFTIDKNMHGPDHKASLSPRELKDMVKKIRLTEKALGSFDKKPTDGEIANLDIVRKSIVAAKDIKIGEEFSIDNITTKRPGNGISPMEWNNIIGKKSTKNYNIDDLI